MRPGPVDVVPDHLIAGGRTSHGRDRHLPVLQRKVLPIFLR